MSGRPSILSLIAGKRDTENRPTPPSQDNQEAEDHLDPDSILGFIEDDDLAGSPAEEYQSTLGMESLSAALDKASEEAHHDPQRLHSMPRESAKSTLDKTSDVIAKIDEKIRQLEWLKSTIQRTPNDANRYYAGLQAIAYCLDDRLDTFFKREQKSYFPSEPELRANSAIACMERDAAEANAEALLAENKALVDTLNEQRKHLAVSLPAYLIAVETADGLYKALKAYLDGCDWLDKSIEDTGDATCLNVGTTTVKKLRKAGVKTYRDLARLSGSCLLDIDGIGPATYEKLKAEIDRLGIPSLSKILTRHSAFEEPIFHRPYYRDNSDYTFKEFNMAWVSRQARQFEGWRVPDILTEISGCKKFIRCSGVPYISRLYFGGPARDFNYSSIAKSPYYHPEQYDYHFLKLAPVSEAMGMPPNRA